jgi:polyhydroxybutyrate depolymerase
MERTGVRPPPARLRCFAVRRLPVVFVALVAACACGMVVSAAVSASARRARAAQACGRTLPAGSAPIAIRSGGLDRTAIVHVPGTLPAGPVPLVLVLHGAGQQGALFESDTGFSTIADAEGFVAVYPDARPGVDGKPFWNMNDRVVGAADDVGFLRDLLATVAAQACTDPARVFATGMSNGGSMTARIGCELSDRLAAIAPISGGYGSQPACTPVHPVSVLEIHGTLDGVVPYAGKADGSGAVRPYLDHWAAWDACPTKPWGHLIAPRVLRLDWRRCAAGTAVSHLRIGGGVHQVPGGSPPEPGPASPVSAPLLIWRFFATHPRQG